MTQDVESARTNPHWYREAIIYRAHVRAFFDSTSDGVGDFPGLTSRLGYLEDLGIDTLWLLPFYPSPLKDDGYDIADYEHIHPAYGTMDDFDRFIEEAHRRRIRVRTPMQWTGDRNGGFSRADAARLYAPVISDPVYGFTAVNVEAQERPPFSLLNWMTRMITLRKQHAILSRGEIEFVPSPNRKVLAYVRRDTSDTILCVANLSRSVQPVELDLSRFQGMIPVEMLGQTKFPRVGQQPYFLSLGAYAFTWFRLQPTALSTAERTTPESTAAIPDVPPLYVGAVWGTLLDGSVRALIERHLLGPFLQRQPWFQGDRPKSVRFKDWRVLHRGAEPVFLTIVEAELDDPSEERGATVCRQYFVPLALGTAESVTPIQERVPHAVLARVTGARKGAIYDASHDARFAEHLLAANGGAAALRTQHGGVHSDRREASAGAPATEPDAPLALKLFRRVEPGVHPEIEIAHLSTAGFTRVPSIAATVDYARSDGSPTASIGSRPIVTRGAAATNATDSGDGRDALLQFYMLDRSLRELDGELKNRTEWTSIPLNGLVELLGLR